MVPMTLVDDVKEPIGRVSAVGEGTPLSPPLTLSWLRFVRLACVSIFEAGLSFDGCSPLFSDGFFRNTWGDLFLKLVANSRDTCRRP
jgi:hypothetical protein